MGITATGWPGAGIEDAAPSLGLLDRGVVLETGNLALNAERLEGGTVNVADSGIPGPEGTLAAGVLDEDAMPLFDWFHSLLSSSTLDTTRALVTAVFSTTLLQDGVFM